MTINENQFGRVRPVIKVSTPTTSKGRERPTLNLTTKPNQSDSLSEDWDAMIADINRQVETNKNNPRTA